MSLNSLKNLLLPVLCFTTFLTFVTPEAALAERRRNPEKKIERLSKKLNLSESQENDVREIFEKAREDKACREIDSKRETKICRKEKREEIDRQITAVLDESQAKQFEEMKAKREAHRRQRKGRHDRMSEEDRS
ncbi:hypothetical protein BVY02_00090 [bacterium J17]|nr:hypothetical protein BVY02_00090 [bacterium J17]